MNDRNGNPIVVGDVYVVAGEALSEFGADRVALDTKRAVLVDDTVSGAAPTVSQVSTDLVPMTAIVHAPVTVTDSSSVNLTLTGQDVTAAAIFGATSGTVCQGNDSRLSDARTPTAHVHSGADITSGTVATARLSMFGTGDPLGVSTAIASFAGLTHTHDGVVTALLTQASTHQSPDTDTATSALHHTLGTGALQAAAGNHTHAGADITSGTVAVARLPSATTSAQGIVELATNGETSSGVVVQGNDSRLSDARTPTSHAHAASDITSGTLGAAQLPALAGAITSTAGSATTAFGSFKANAILMNMTNASGVPTAVDGTDAAANMWAFLGGSYLLPAWRLSDAKLGSIAI